MLRKKIIIPGIILMAGLFGLISCVDTLEVEPTVELESNFFTDEFRVQRGVAGPYAKIADIYGAGYFDEGPFCEIWMLPGDDITFEGSGNEFESFSRLNSTNNRLKGLWLRLYQIVNRSNFMLEKINDPAIQSVYTTEGLMEANRGELLFLRSWAFYQLWDWFRKAPIQVERINSIDGAILSPSSGFEMLDNAISSLEEAVPLLPDSWDNENAGRITKDGAYGLLVKCYVMRACYNSKNTEDYSKAISAFEKISASRQLVIPFGNNFDVRTENNSESLFEFQAGHNYNYNHPWQDNDFGGNNGQMGTYLHMWNAHWANGYGFGGSFGPTQKLVNAFEPGDPRIFETLSDSADNLNGIHWWVVPQWDKFGGYQMVKYSNGPRVAGSWGNSFDVLSVNNWRIIRLADVKLCAAEAYLATGAADKALKQVNDVRERARKSTPNGVESTVPANLSSVNIDDVMHERMVELAGEGIRWTDLRRWHAAGYINLSSWSASDFDFPFSSDLFAFDPSKHLLFPIPQDELDRNPEMAASGNNPGY
ncbi:MAG: RagB/SusD family nutrient uptake outer membrane protein [Prolixibacteraceae bacterium]|jgi:hypothetical protein|nr:RagB/SusD family nutrient uptake outer membrane protein [Prolixibacteraceae bacterium]